ncbi:hypothetical protein [Pelomonas cellulosilytica]|uniref:Lipoprotein n=1 Tax=Pelomonas cellulosilytica TaxID=2906762 RepID=A0ABS8XNI2_9BURK|nr:hypothetical protein [Pelomonas sp. P8]MCE4554334.1 hypothetical protein [Pelomonas sp. P8]
MKEMTRDHASEPQSPAAQREGRTGGGSMSAQLALSPRLLAQRRSLDDAACEPVQRVEQPLAQEAGNRVHQLAAVAQLNTVRSAPVQFRGTAEQLRQLILQWNALKGITVQVQATDYVSDSRDITGTYTATFTQNANGLTQGQADDWVDRALAHAESSSSDESQHESSSDEATTGIVVQSTDGLMTLGDSATPTGDGRYYVVVQGVHHLARKNGSIYELL